MRKRSGKRCWISWGGNKRYLSRLRDLANQGLLGSFGVEIIGLYGSITAIDGEDGAGDVRGFGGSEEDGGGVEFAGVAIALHGDMGAGEGLEGVGFEDGFGKFGVEKAGANGVTSNSLLGEFSGDGASEVDDGAF